MNNFAKSFEKLCGVVAVIIILLNGVLGYFTGSAMNDYLDIYGGSDLYVWVIIGFVILFCAIGYVFDVLLFGFYAQIVEIKNELKKLNDK